MIPAPYQSFLSASVQASAALIGLLFVSISIAPERVFGGTAESRRQAQALSAFTALANVFFISFFSLIPNISLGPIITGIAGVAVLQTLGLLLLLPQWRREHALRRGLFLFLLSAVIYGGEIEVGISLWIKPLDSGALTGLLEILLGAYAIGLGRAWELLGARRLGSLIGGVVRAAPSRSESQPPDAAND
jgi:hypothetical protein